MRDAVKPDRLRSMNALQNVDPDWAWAPYEPSPERPWNRRAAAHLFRRAAFGASHAELTTAMNRSPDEVVDHLLQIELEPAAFRSQCADLVRAALASGNIQRLAAQWVYRMLMTPVPLLEKMTLFWHGHFATSAEKVKDAELMQRQNELLRRFALGDFPELLLEISRDPAMLIYLDSVTNRKAHPNENYAREVMELFCLGEGNYSERDIRELARCFTGWEIKRKRFRFNRYQHDAGTKSVLGRSGRFGGEDGVAIVASQAAAPTFLARKLVRYFLMDEPESSEALIAPLAKQLRDDQLLIRPTVRRILSSNLMFSEHAIARKIRSPAEFVSGVLRGLEGTANLMEVASGLGQLGQALFAPPSVKGWDGGRAWINSSTLLARSNLIRRMLDSDKTRFGKRSLAEYFASVGVDKDNVVDWVEEAWFAVDLPPAARRQATGRLRDASADNDQALRDVIHFLCTLPEFQLC